MSYTAEIRNAAIADTAIEVKQAKTSQELLDEASPKAVFSYALCCGVQGLVGAFYLMVICLAPIAIHLGLFSTP